MYKVEGVANCVAVVTGPEIDRVEVAEEVSNVEDVLAGYVSKRLGREGDVNLMVGTPTVGKATNTSKISDIPTIAQTSGFEKSGYMGIDLENKLGS